MDWTPRARPEEPIPQEGLPPRNAGSELTGTTARTPDTHWVCDALEIEPAPTLLEPLPPGTDWTAELVDCLPDAEFCMCFHHPAFESTYKILQPAGPRGCQESKRPVGTPTGFQSTNFVFCALNGANGPAHGAAGMTDPHPINTSLTLSSRGWRGCCAPGHRAE
jgi:hypothetical protein